MKRSSDCLRIIIVLVGCLLFVPGCGKDDNGATDPNNGKIKNPVSAGFGALALALNEALGENASAYRSLEYFSLIIGDSYRANSSINGMNPEVNGAAETCLPQSVQGVLFRYDTDLGEYVPTGDPGTPATSVRYVLYDVDPSGDLVLPLNEIGYLEAECRGSLPTDTLGVKVVSSGIEILDIELRGFLIDPPDYIFGASPIVLRNAAGNDVLRILAVADGTMRKYLNETVEIVDGLQAFDSRLQGFHATIGRRDSLTQSDLPEPPFEILSIGANKIDESTQTVLWNASVGMIVDEYGNISNIFHGYKAPLQFEDRVQYTNGNLACFSGSYDSPLVEDSGSDDGCAMGYIVNPIPLTEEELGAIRSGYLKLLELLDAITPFWLIGMEIMAP